MKRIAFGPMVNLPSTEWVGRDVAEYIKATSDNIRVELFNSFEDIPNVDVIFIIKLMPTLKWLLNAKQKKIRLLYFPVDYFHHPALFPKEKVKLELFDCILLHNERLLDNLPSSVANVEFVDHYLKYCLPTAKTFKDEGFILWVGHIEYLPSLFKALSEHGLPHPLKALTDLENLLVKTDVLRKRLKQISLPYSLEEGDHEMILNGVKLEQWSSKKQEEYMLTCKAAFDTKNDGFAHNLKPPTKGQKYVFNGIPFAISEYSYAYDYFLSKGLKLATLKTPERWLSEDYFNEINEFKNRYGYTQTIDYVSKKYLLEAENSLNRLPRQRLGKCLRLYLAFRDFKNNAIYIACRAIEKIKNWTLKSDQQ